MDPIRKKRKELQDERLSEFAPPSSYQPPAPSTQQQSTSGEPLNQQDSTTTGRESCHGSPSLPPPVNIYPPSYNPYLVFPNYPPPVFPMPPYPPGFIPTNSYSQQSHYPSNQWLLFQISLNVLYCIIVFTGLPTVPDFPGVSRFWGCSLGLPAKEFILLGTEAGHVSLAISVSSKSHGKILHCGHNWTR